MCRENKDLNNYELVKEFSKLNYKCTLMADIMNNLEKYGISEIDLAQSDTIEEMVNNIKKVKRKIHIREKLSRI